MTSSAGVSLFRRNPAPALLFTQVIIPAARSLLYRLLSAWLFNMTYWSRVPSNICFGMQSTKCQIQAAAGSGGQPLQTSLCEKNRLYHFKVQLDFKRSVSQAFYLRAAKFEGGNMSSRMYSFLWFDLVFLCKKLCYYCKDSCKSESFSLNQHTVIDSSTCKQACTRKAAKHCMWVEGVVRTGFLRVLAAFIQLYMEILNLIIQNDISPRQAVSLDLIWL